MTGPGVRSVGAWLAISIALSAAAAILGIAAALADPLVLGAREQGWAFAITAAPYAAAITILALQRRGLGLGLALGAAVAGLVVGVPRLVGWVLMGMQTASSLGIASSLCGVLVVPAQVLLASTAWRAGRALPPSERLHRSVWLAALGAPTLFYLLAGATAFVVATDWRAVRAQEASERAGRRAVEEIVRCTNAYTEHHPQRSRPPSLAALGPDGDTCLDAATAGGAAQGYRLTYLPGVADAAGRIRRFAVCAQPEDVRRGAVQTLVAGPDGRVAAYVPSSVDDIEAGRALPCAAPWFIAENDPMRGLEVCLLEWAGAHPGAGYPRTLRALGPEGERCIPDVGVRALDDTHLGIPPHAIFYEPTAPDERGLVVEFALRSDRSGSPASSLP